MPTITRTIQPPGALLDFPTTGAVVTNTSAFSIRIEGTVVAAAGTYTLQGSDLSANVETSTTATISATYTAGSDTVLGSPLLFATKALAEEGVVGLASAVVYVTDDESKGGGPALYLWNGSAFYWIAATEDN